MIAYPLYRYNDRHDLLPDNLLIVRNVLIISIYKINKSAKETNWKQKLPKTPSCKQEKTKINVESIGNLHFLSLGIQTRMVVVEFFKW